MADDDQTINLRILSPSTEVEGGVSLPDLPASTTIKELRGRIQDAVPSRPAPDRMRLIYRGRVVANDADTLRHVFGDVNIRESMDQSLHLVLRELPPSGTPSSSTGPRAATVPPNPFRPAQQSPQALPASPLQTNPFRTIPQPRPESQPLPPPQQQPHHAHPHSHAHAHAHHHHHLPAPVNPFPIRLPPAFEQHLAQAMAQGHPPGGPPPLPANTNMPLPGTPNLPPNGARTIHQEGVGPNGERWTVTYNTVNLPARPPQPTMPQPSVHPQGFGLPTPPTGSPAPTDVIDRLLPRIRAILQSARQEMDNVRTLLHMSGGQQATPAASLGPVNPPPWRVERIRDHVRTMSRNLDLVERGLAVILADTSLAQNADVVALRQAANELRTHAEEMNSMLAREQDATTGEQPTSSARTPSVAPVTPATTSSESTPSLPQPQNSIQTMPADTPAELFILSSPQGPVGLLFDQRGTYTTAPMVSTLPFQTYTDQFAQNRQRIAGLGQQMAQANELQNQLLNTPPPPMQQPAGAPVQDQNQNAAQVQVQHQNLPINANGDANQPVENDRVVNVAGHLWLIVKLACFVYFFAGGGSGWYRPVLLGLIAGVVYLAQIGIFEEHFNLIRRHFEALLPVGALADRIVEPRNANDQTQGQQRTTSVRVLTPEQAAQRILQQRQDERFGWVRQSMRTVERSFALFVASLWPGIGERMVHAQEERLRVERVAATEAEEERQKQEEARKQEGEVQQQGEAQAKAKEIREGDVEDKAAASSSAKGKEKAATANTEGGTVGSS